MRVWVAMLSWLLLAHGAAAREFVVGEDERALVIIGVAEQASEADPAYSMLWRRVTDDGTFGEWDSDVAFEARTSANDTVRVRGVPGEFTFAEVPPGTYALDSVFAEIEERRLIYFANGAVTGPSRPSFEVRAGEAVYLGIWLAHLDTTGNVATASLWRLDSADARAAVDPSEEIVGEVHVRATRMLDVPCAPQRMGMSRREICGVAEAGSE